MSRPTYLYTILLCVLLCGSTLHSTAQRSTPISEVPFTQVTLDDHFWLPRIETNRTVSIPSAFRECERNGRFDNFAIAGGLMQGEHRGDFSFDDTDPYKVIEGASYSLAVHHDAALEAYLDSVIAIIAAAQEPDGYLTTCVTNRCTRLSGWWGKSRWERINSHELYNSGHLYEAAVAHYRATGKRSLLDVAIRNADLVCQVFGSGEGQKHVPSGHPIVEMALARLYQVTGEQRYLDAARYFVEETGRGTDGHTLSAYSQDHMPILQQEEIVGHAVRACYLYSGVADVAALTGDTAYLHALQRIWQNMASRKLYITGGIGSRAQGKGFGPDYELHNHTAYCETCAAIGCVFWNHRMFLATGEAKYYDVLERSLYNGVLSGVSISGDRFFYDNPLESMGEHERQPWFGCACCPGNITRFMASVPGYMYATSDNGIWVNLYIQGQARMEVAGNEVQLTQHTDYPWDGRIGLSIQPRKARRMALHLRIPGWTRQDPFGTGLYRYIDAQPRISISVNGKPASYVCRNGYAIIDRTWHRGDTITLDLPMEVRQLCADTRVSDDRGCLALSRGPVVYCLEQCDQPDSTVLDKFISPHTSLSTFHATDLGGYTGIEGMAHKACRDGSTQPIPFKAIPYALWNNRGRGEMQVWIASSKEAAHLYPETGIALRAHAYQVQAALQKDAPASAATLTPVWGVNDGWEPTHSADTSKPYHYWWLRYGTTESLCYEFDAPHTVSSVEVYWLDIDHYDGNFRVPEWWQLYYKEGDRWLPVKTANAYLTHKDRYNRLDFEPVTTDALKIEAKLQQGASGGILEWEVR